MKYSSKLSINLQSLTDFISGSLANSSAGLATGHITLASTLEAFCNQSKSSKQDKDGLVPFLLEASVRYPYKEIAVNLTSSLGNVRPCSQRIEALGKLLRKELDKYVDSSFGFAHDAKINGEDIRLLSNIMKGFRMNGPCSGTEWFDCFVACMHFPSKHDFSWEVRKSAIDSVSDDLFGIFDEDKKAVLIHSLAYLTYKDDSEIVRSVASEKLSTMEKDSAVVEPFLMSLPKSCKALGAQSGGSQKATKRSKKAPQAEVQNRFKWVREVLEDQENLGLSSTILALEVLDLAEFENLNYLSTPLLETLELLLYLHQAVVDKSGNSRIQSSKVFATAAAAAKTFVNKEIDITSQARYGIELGLQALYNIAGGSVSKTVRVSIVGLSLKCMQFMEQASIHENALDILNQVIGDLPKRELESHASNVFAAVMDSLHLHVQWSASNHKFFKSVLGVLKPFLSNKSTMDQTLDEICRKVAEFERSDQEVFFALAQQIWDGDSLLDMLLEKAFEHAKQGAEEFAGIICEGYSGTKCLEALRNLLSNAGEDSLKMKVSFAIEVIASNRLRYSESDRSAKESTLVEVVKQASKTYGAEEGSEETLQQLYFDLLGEFEEICTPEELFGPLASLCDSGDENLLRTTLDLMSHKLSQQQKKLKAEVGTLVFEAVSGSLFKTTSEETKQACLGTLGQSLKHYKGSSVLELVDKLLLVPQAEEATASAIIFFFGASLITLKSRAIPCLPSVAKHVLGSLEEAIKESSLPVIQASLFTLESLVIHHGGMVGPYLSKLFELWKVLMGSESGNNSEAEALSLLLHVSEDVPVRILLPALLETLNLPCLPAVAKPLVDMLNNLLQTMDHSAIQTNHFDVVNYVLGALDGRRMHKMADSEYSSLECSLVDCFVSLVMKLSEASFRPVFLHVLDWSTKGTVNEGDVLDLKMARGISLFHLVIKITEKLRSIFVPYFKHLMETACGWLEERQKNSKRAKKRSKPSSDESVALWTLKLEVVHSLQKCFAYDTVGFTEENTFDEVLPIILDSLNDQPSSAIAAEVDALAESLLGVTASQRQEDEMELDAEEEDLPCYKNLDLMARETAECLNKMAIAGNNDTVWKRFNSKVLMASRTENPRVKLVCIECVSQLAQFLREDYIVLIAETVPFIAELLEDKEHGVQVACKEFVRKLEEISGEDLSQYMA
uniref:BP28 C-terminal domain-containing protein n=1 Tax=Chloropicon primus TaxID=1764295 RepID=A0A7S2T4J1_9CHLO